MLIFFIIFLWLVINFPLFVDSFPLDNSLPADWRAGPSKNEASPKEKIATPP